MHTFSWLNLLLEPKRHLQRFGFVYLEHVFPPKNTPLGVEGRWLGGSTVLPLGVAPRYPRGRVRLPSEGKKTTLSLPPKKIVKKFVIGRHAVHTFPWLNLLLEPKRHLQRFGFVYLEHVFPPKNTPLGVEGRWLGGSTVLPLGVALRHPKGRGRLPSEPVYPQGKRKGPRFLASPLFALRQSRYFVGLTFTL